ncbi:hypothetical protein J6590_071662, partial [Homalodisca vitripennis]
MTCRVTGFHEIACKIKNLYLIQFQEISRRPANRERQTLEVLTGENETKRCYRTVKSTNN